MGLTSLAVDKRRMGERDRGRVLLVMNGALGELCRRALEEVNIYVASASCGMAAIVSLQRERPHIVVAANDLTDLKAAELTRALARLQEGLPLIFVGTDEATLERRGGALALGAFDYFSLPAELSLFVARVRQLAQIQLTIDKLRAEADKDYLTGLANRRRFRVALGHEVERWRRYGIPCSLLLLDIDHLKTINDTHGHSGGDVVIRHVARTLKDFSRDNDTAARLGGEEFALLLAGTGDEKAWIVAERLRNAIASVAIEKVGAATVSVGVASCPAHAQSERELYAAADGALYRAKNAGRNRVCLAEKAAARDAKAHG
jgi:diguanylate cyclase (GGDEF)-like protein